MKTFIIGDVHGCFNTLMSLVNKLPKNSNLIFSGDLCDKGLFSCDVFEFVINNNFKCIKGNHEHYMELNAIDAKYKDIPSKWSTEPELYGGSQTLDSYENKDELLKKHLGWIDNLPSYIIINNYFITHSYGLPYFQRRDCEDSKKPLLSNRINDKKYMDNWEDVSKNEVINIFGHCHFKEVEIDKDKKYYGIDTGCVYGNKLTAFELYSHEIIQVETDKKDLGPIFINNKDNAPIQLTSAI